MNFLFSFISTKTKKNGVDPNQRESQHNLSAIHILVDGPYKGQNITEQQRAQLIRSMVKNGANVNQLDKYEMAPIHKLLFIFIFKEMREI